MRKTMNSNTVHITECYGCVFYHLFTGYVGSTDEGQQVRGKQVTNPHYTEARL